MSWPAGSGFAVSKSITASAASTGSDFLYPTAFIWRVSSSRRSTAALEHLGAGLAMELQGLRDDLASLARSFGLGSITGCPVAPRLLFAGRGAYICPVNSRESFHDRCSVFHGIARPVGCGPGNVNVQHLAI